MIRTTTRIALFTAKALLVLVSYLLFLVALLYWVTPTAPFQNAYIAGLAESFISAQLRGAAVSLDNMTFLKATKDQPFTIRVNRVRIYPVDEAGGAADFPVMSGTDLVIEMGFSSWLHGRPLKSLSAQSLSFLATQDADGAHRFSLNETQDAATGPKEPFNPFSILGIADEIRVGDVRLMLDDDTHRAPETIAYVAVDMERNEEFDQSYATVTLREQKDQTAPNVDMVLTTTDFEIMGEVVVYFHDLGFDRVAPWIPFLSKHTALIEGIATGEARLQYNKLRHSIADFALQLRVPDGRVQLVDTAPKPIAFKDIQIDVAPKIGTIKGLFNDRQVDVALKATDKDNVPYELAVRVPELRAEDIVPYWPEDSAGVAWEWTTQKMKDGAFRDINVTGEIEASPRKTGWDFINPKVTFKTDSMWVLYKHDLAPATNLMSEGTFENGNLLLDLKSGQVKGLDLLEGRLTFIDLIEAGKGDCRGFLRLRGSLGNLLSYLDNPIMKYKERTDLDLTKAGGSVQMTVALDFPTTKDARTDQIKVNVDAILRGASLPDVISGISLSGGALAVKADPKQVRIFGEANINKAPARLDWQSYFDKVNVPFAQKLELKGSVTRDTLAGLGAGSWARDLNTPSTANMNWTQPVSGPSNIALQVTGPDFSIAQSTVRMDKGGFAGGTFNGVTLGRTKGDVTLARGKSGGYDASFNGQTLDVRPMLSSDKSNSSSSKPANLSLSLKSATLITSDKTSLTDAAITAATNGRGDVSRLDLDARAEGTPVKVRFSEGGNGDTLRMEAADAGAFLRATGFSQSVQGGVLQVQGNPGGGYGRMKGRARISNFTARDVPALGRLINALSLPGLFQLLTDEGIAFERLRSDFTWSPSNGGQLSLHNGTTRGASLGLTFEGTYQQKAKRIDLNGQIVPLSGVSNIVNQIPLVGTLLTGGENGGLVAATYTMRGNIGDPQTFINPLSILTPGILRRILFESETPEQE